VDVMRFVCWNLRLLPAGLVSPGYSYSSLSGSVSLAMSFTLGTDSGSMRPGVDSDVTASSRRLFLQSTMSP